MGNTFYGDITEKALGKENAKQLNRQVVVTGRSKAVNEKIYYNVDML